MNYTQLIEVIKILQNSTEDRTLHSPLSHYNLLKGFWGELQRDYTGVDSMQFKIAEFLDDELDLYLTYNTSRNTLIVSLIAQHDADRAEELGLLYGDTIESYDFMFRGIPSTENNLLLSVCAACYCVLIRNPYNKVLYTDANSIAESLKALKLE